MDPIDLVSGVVRLVSLPEVCIRVTEMLEDPRTNATDLGNVISRDTSLTARLLKIVNSAYYGFQSRIETVTRAITIIGLRELRGLVLAASAIEAFSKIPNELLNMAHFWRHSVYCGVVGQILAKECHVLHGERLFIAGLLHDIGKLIICHRLPDQAQEIMEKTIVENRLDFEVEKEVLGFDHTDIGGMLLSEWNMPDSLREAVQFHHDPHGAQEAVLDACLVHIANIMTGMAENGADIKINIQAFDPYAWKMTNLDESIIDSVYVQASPKFAEALETILPKSYLPY